MPNSRSRWRIPPLLTCLVTAAVTVHGITTHSQGRSSARRRVVFVSGREAVANEALVTLKHMATAAERGELAVSVDADEDEPLAPRIHRMHSRRFDAELLLAYLQTHPSVEAVEPNWIVHADLIPDDSKFPKLWGLRNTGQRVNYGAAGTTGADIHAVSAWDLTTGSRRNVVAVIDTGIDYTHPDLAANMWSAPAAFTVTIGGIAINCAAGTHGFDAIASTCDPRDDNEHGTHVAGTIGAAGNNGFGVVGVNWRASMMGLKFLDASGTGTTADAIRAIEFAIQAKGRFQATAGANVRVLSNSWNGGGFSQALLDEINKAASKDMLFVASAGNGATNVDYLPSYPGSYKASNVISVAATDNSDLLASFSNFGSSVDLAAPGVNILSTVPGATYRYLSGTSMAAPYVSGAAALVLAKCALNTAGVKTTLLGHVDLVGSLTGWVRSNGRLNVSRAVRGCASIALGTDPSGASSVPPAPTNVKATTGVNAGEIRITWTASAGAAYYKVKRSTLSTGPYSTIVTTGSTGYTNKYLTSGKTYYYLATAVNAAGQSADSNHTWAVVR